MVPLRCCLPNCWYFYLPEAAPEVRFFCVLQNRYINSSSHADFCCRMPTNMDTIFTFSNIIVFSSTSIVKFFVPKILRSPKILLFGSLRIVTFLLPQRLVDLSLRGMRCVGILTSLLKLMEKVQLLEEQIGALKESSLQNDERYTRARVEKATLTQRIISLEEQIRDMEIRYEERLQEEQRRSKELISRLEREKQLQLENANIRLQSCEAECCNLKEELTRHRILIQKIESERKQLMEQVQELNEEVHFAKDEAATSKELEKRLNRECEAKNQLIEELSLEVEKLRAEARTPALPTTSVDALRLEELHEELSILRDKNLKLEEVNEELQASLLHAGLEQGKLLTSHETSLAAELEAMSKDEIQRALKEQQDVNSQLKNYIDGILLNIVENYPQLLEVKQKS